MREKDYLKIEKKEKHENTGNALEGEEWERNNGMKMELEIGEA